MSETRSKKDAQRATPNASLKAALAKLAAAQTSQQTDLAKTLKKVADAQRATPNASLKAALAKLAAAQTSQQTDLPKTLRRISDAQRTVPNAALTSKLADISAIAHHKPRFESTQAASQTGFQVGLKQLADFNLNPWAKPEQLFFGSATAGLERDWRRVEADLWTTVGKLRSQLGEIPQAEREHVTNALVHYLRSEGF